jgi:hypothetical protein
MPRWISALAAHVALAASLAGAPGCGGAAPTSAEHAAPTEATMAAPEETAGPGHDVDLKGGVVVSHLAPAPTVAARTSGAASTGEGGLLDAGGAKGGGPAQAALQPIGGAKGDKAAASAPAKKPKKEPGAPSDTAMSPPPVTPQSATTTSLGGEITEADVDAALSPKLRELRACAVGDTQLSVHVSLAPGGRVAEAAVTKSTPDDPRLRDCVELVMRGLAFRAASAEHGSALTFDLALKPLDGG